MTEVPPSSVAGDRKKILVRAERSRQTQLHPHEAAGEYSYRLSLSDANQNIGQLRSSEGQA